MGLGNSVLVFRIFNYTSSLLNQRQVYMQEKGDDNFEKRVIILKVNCVIPAG